MMEVLCSTLGISLHELKNMNKRQLIYQIINVSMVVSTAWMIWRGLTLISGSDSPVVVVLSGSMEPAFYRGDLLFLKHIRDEPINVGEIVVFKIKNREIPIVHRVIKVHRNDTDVRFLTKGDNNRVDDRGLYEPGQAWLENKHVIGKAVGCVPYIGMVTIIMNDYPKFKYIVLSLMGLYTLTNRET
ncbi:hypothetical protein GJ496_005820 [Pomphorhynchus laevis]|nr:hypothetical protein GJ496_005820 [Pomphorhynchus laevis]